MFAPEHNLPSPLVLWGFFSTRINMLRQALNTFAEQMEVKLQHDYSNPSWRKCSNGHLLSRIRHETAEVAAAFNSNYPQDAKDKCVAVANLAMMLFDNLNNKD